MWAARNDEGASADEEDMSASEGEEEKLDETRNLSFEEARAMVGTWLDEAAALQPPEYLPPIPSERRLEALRAHPGPLARFVKRLSETIIDVPTSAHTALLYTFYDEENQILLVRVRKGKTESWKSLPLVDIVWRDALTPLLGMVWNILRALDEDRKTYGPSYDKLKSPPSLFPDDPVSSYALLHPDESIDGAIYVGLTERYRGLCRYNEPRRFGRICQALYRKYSCVCPNLRLVPGSIAFAGERRVYCDMATIMRALNSSIVEVYPSYLACKTLLESERVQSLIRGHHLWDKNLMRLVRGFLPQ